MTSNNLYLLDQVALDDKKHSTFFSDFSSEDFPEAHVQV
jgi:hypothetical protein